MPRQRGAITLSQRDKRIAAACIENAEDLVASAELVLKADQPGIAFHLALLGIEEIGKRGIVLLNALSRRREQTEVIGERKLDDHVGKIFWAFFFRLIFLEKIDEAAIEEIRGLAKFLHARRLESLYVDPERIPFKRPKNILAL